MNPLKTLISKLFAINAKNVNNQVDAILQAQDVKKVFWSKAALYAAATISGASFAFMIRSYQVGWFGAVIIGFLWATIIWTMDNFMLAHVDKTALIKYELEPENRAWHENTFFLQIQLLFSLGNIVRFTLSFCVASLVSRPIEIAFFRTSIEAKIIEMTEQEKQAGDAERAKPIEKIEAEIKQLEEKKTIKQAEKEKGLDINTAETKEISDCQNELIELRKSKSELENQKNEVRRNFVEWSNGKKSLSEEGYKQLKSIDRDLKPINELIYSKNKECGNDKQTIALRKNDFQNDKTNEIARIQADIDKKKAEINDIKSENAGKKRDADAKIDRNAFGFVVESRALASFVSENTSAWYLEKIIYAIFMLFELLPLLIKIFSKPLVSEIIDYISTKQTLKLVEITHQQELEKVQQLAAKQQEAELNHQALKQREKDKMAQEIAKLQAETEQKKVLLQTELDGFDSLIIKLQKETEVAETILALQLKKAEQELKNANQQFEIELNKKIHELAQKKKIHEQKVKESEEKILEEGIEAEKFEQQKEIIAQTMEKRIQEQHLKDYEEQAKKQNRELLSEIAKAQREVAERLLKEWKNSQIG